MAITGIQSGSGNSAVSTTVTLTYGSTPTNGNYLICFLLTSSTTGSTGPAGWSKIDSASTANAIGELWWKNAGAGESTTYQWTGLSALADSLVIAREYSGVHAGVVGINSEGFRTGSNSTSTEIASVLNCRALAWWGVYFSGSNPTWSGLSSGWTANTTVDSVLVHCQMATRDTITAEGGANNPSNTPSSQTQRINCLVILQPASPYTETRTVTSATTDKSLRLPSAIRVKASATTSKRVVSDTALRKIVTGIYKRILSDAVSHKIISATIPKSIRIDSAKRIIISATAGVSRRLLSAIRKIGSGSYRRAVSALVGRKNTSGATAHSLRLPNSLRKIANVSSAHSIRSSLPLRHVLSATAKSRRFSGLSIRRVASGTIGIFRRALILKRIVVVIIANRLIRLSLSARRIMTGAYHLFTAIISVRHIASLVNAYKIHTHFFTGHISSSGIGRRLALIAASRRDISATGKKSLRLITAIRRLASRAVATSSSQSAIEVFVVASVAVGHSLRNIIAERRSGSPVAGASQKIIGSLRRIASRVVGFFSGNKYGRAPILLTVTMPTIIIGSVIMPTMIARNVTMPVEIDLSLIIP